MQLGHDRRCVRQEVLEVVEDDKARTLPDRRRKFFELRPGTGQGYPQLAGDGGGDMLGGIHAGQLDHRHTEPIVLTVAGECELVGETGFAHPTESGEGHQPAPHRTRAGMKERGKAEKLDISAEDRPAGLSYAGADVVVSCCPPTVRFAGNPQRDRIGGSCQPLFEDRCARHIEPGHEFNLHGTRPTRDRRPQGGPRVPDLLNV